MSLPEPNTAWPPPELAKVQARTAESQVWWEGDPDKLNDFYGGQQKASPSGVRSRTRAAYDAFWGRTQTQTAQTPKKYHAPIAGVITKLSASELFNEPVTFVSADDQARADLIFNTPTFHSSLLEAGEQCSALSGSFQRVVWDDTIADNAWLDFVDADRAIPEFRWGRLVAVTFWSELDGSDDRDVWRHLERHEPGRVIHSLYKGTATSLGRSMDLAAHPATQGIKVVLGADGYSHVETGVKELTAAYVPNVTPNPEWRNDPRLKHLGRADISTDLIPSYHELDRIFSSLMRDYRIGAGRVYASESVLQNLGAGNGMAMDESQEIFTKVGSAGFTNEGEIKTLFEFFQPEIRVLEHDQGGNILLREVLRKTGYSPVSLGMSDEVAQTATEASGKKDLTVKTTSAKARHWGSALGPLSTTCLRVDAIKFPGKGKAPTEDLELDWPKFARESDESKSRTVQGWETARAASTRTKVAYLHEDWDEQRIDEEVALIEKANVPPPDPFGAPDGNPANPAPTTPDEPATEGDKGVTEGE